MFLVLRFFRMIVSACNKPVSLSLQIAPGFTDARERRFATTLREEPTMRRAVIVTLMLIVTASVIASDKKDGAQSTRAGLEQTAKIFFDAVKANDTAKIKSYYTPDYTFTGPDGKMMNGEERLKVMAARGTDPFLSYSDLNVRTYRSTGVVTGIATTKNSTGGTDQGRFTQAWTWQRGRWWLAASHVSRISQ